jgi:hypothetical protein
MSDDPIFILGIHKSGTSLLRSLLDSSPGLAVLPREAHFFERLGFGVSYPLRPAALGPETEESFLVRVREALSEEAVDTNAFSDSPDFRGYDPDRFLERWKRTGEWDQSLAPLYMRYADALWWSVTGQPLDGLRAVDKSIEYLEFGELLNRMFPGASLILVMRNPYATLVAYRRYRASHAGQYPDIRLIGRALAHGYYWVRRLQRTMPRAVVVRYEDLVQDTERTMRRLAESIGVPYTDSMLSPTELGASWGGHSSTGTKFTGVSTARAEAWRNEVAAAEVYLVNRSLPQQFWAEFGYEMMQISRRGALARSRGEGLRDYLRNRV